MFAISVLAISAFAANPQKRLVTIVADTSTKFQTSMISGDPVYVQSTKTWYTLKTDIWKPNTYNMRWVLASSSRYDIAYQTAGFTGTTITLAGNETIGGTLTVSSTSTFTSAATFNSGLTGTLTGSASLNWLKTDTSYAVKKPETYYHSLITYAPLANPTFTGTVIATTINATNLTVSGPANLTGAFYANTIIKNVTPVAKTATETMSTTTLLSGVVAVTNTVAVTLTTPAATAISGAITGSGQGTEFDLVIDNSASSVAGTVTLAFGSGVAAGTAVWTGEDTMTVAYGKVGCFHFYEVSASDFRVYRKF